MYRINSLYVFNVYVLCSFFLKGYVYLAYEVESCDIDISVPIDEHILFYSILCTDKLLVHRNIPSQVK